ncbi:unnamed protein product, partial [Candidula unifasciata]
NNSAKGKCRDQSPVDKARQLVTTLSNLEKETADSIWIEVDLGPAPLDQYLKYPEKAGSPYPKLGHHSRQKKKLLENVDNFQEAKNVLRHLEETRLTLENNIDQVVRSRRDVHLFSTLLGSESNRVNDDQLRIEKLVNKKISALEGDVQRGVLRGLALAEAEKLAAQQELELATKRKLEQGKSALLKGQADRSARLSYSKPNSLTTTNVNNKGKENRGSKVRLPLKPAAIKDEATRVRTYGKPEYLRGRTTIRDPYLHFKNAKKGVAAKSSLTNLNESARSREGRSRSPPRHGQEPVIDPMPRQFYFSPTRGYIPLGGGDTAPIQGQLVSMAVPLGAPRIEPGLRRSAAPVTRSSSGPVSSTPVPVTAARNVAMVSFPGDKNEQGHAERQPELTKQVLPPVDIDSISPSSSQRSDIHFRSPQQDHANLTFLFDSRNEADESKLPHTEENSELEQSGEGIRLPGYEPKTAPYSGPSFPPQIRNPGWADGAGEVVAAQQMSDVMAEDLRRRDMLENNAVIWLEQELMARVLSQMPQQVTERPADASQAESEASDKDESLLVTDMVGQSGMQLFIDAGQPVDNALIQDLIKVVIREKILAMMAQRETEGEGQVRVRNEVEEALEEKEAEEIATGSHRVPTPQPTPKSSPIPSPKQTRQQPPQPATPPQSPPLDGYRFKPVEPEPPKSPEPLRQPQATAEPLGILTIVESESESSLSLDISEELRRIAAKGKPMTVEEMGTVCHDVATPPLSPPAEEEKWEVFPERQVTPPATPPITKTPPRIRTPSPMRKEPFIESEEEEVLDEDIIEQPQPIKISVGVGDDRPLTTETQTQHTSSSPKRPLTAASEESETASLSTESTATETVNEWISEGQWLLSYSEGQVVGAVNYEAIRKEIAGRGYEHIVDVSTASTLRDTEDLDLDIEGTRSEGEFLHGGFLDPDKDPRLEVLAQLQKRTIHVQQFHPGPAPRVMSSTGRSVGEMSIGQVPPSRIAAEQTRKYGEHLQRGRGGRARSPSSTLEKNLEENYAYKKDTQDRRQELEQHHIRTQSPQEDTYSRTASPQQRPRSRTPSPQQQKRSRTPPQQDRRTQVQYQPVLSEGRPLSARGRTLPGKQDRRRNSDVRLSQTSDPGVRRSDSTYNSESLSRSADGDSFRRSANGFLASSLKSRNSAVKKSVEFDLSGTQQSSKRGSRDLSEDMGPSNSAVLTYTQDSLDEAELHRIGAETGTSSYAGTYRMSVTIPSGAEGEDSEISEIDLSSKSDK